MDDRNKKDTLLYWYSIMVSILLFTTPQILQTEPISSFRTKECSHSSSPSFSSSSGSTATSYRKHFKCESDIRNFEEWNSKRKREGGKRTFQEKKSSAIYNFFWQAKGKKSIKLIQEVHKEPRGAKKEDRKNKPAHHLTKKKAKCSHKYYTTNISQGINPHS